MANGPGKTDCSGWTQIRRSLLSVLVLLAVVLGVVGSQPGRAAADPSYAGWAIEAYPSLSSADFVAALTRMQSHGANFIWVGQCNPAAVDPNANEVGLCYPVYAAAINPADPNNATANSILAAQRRLLNAARTVGMKVVLPVNYRTQMGDAWNASHGSSLRAGPDGTVLNFGGVDASPYAVDFRSATAQYYRWVDQNFLGPYRDVILMVNLSDEPTGVDYSSPANDAFFQQTGYHFADVGNDPGRVELLGRFQSEVVVDFATWAADQWQSIDPAVTVTLSFDGGPGRTSQQAPNLEDIFRRAPPNFQPAWDAFLRDGTPTDALNDADITALITLIGTLSHFSAQYGHPFWLWSGANSWGLGPGSTDPSTIADAMVNLHLLADVARQAGGSLRGIALWNYNLRGVGLYNDSYRTVYSADDFFNRVSAELRAVRQILAGPAGPGPDSLILAPNRLPDQLIGSTRLADIWALQGYNFDELVSLTRSGSTPAVVNTLAGQNLAGIRLLIVLARVPGDLSPPDISAIRTYRASGGQVVDSQTVDPAYAFGAQWVAPGNAPEVLFGTAYTRDNVGPIAALGLPKLVNSFAIVGPSETIAYGGTSLDSADKMRAWPVLAAPATGTVYAAEGTASSQLTVGPGLVGVPTQRHTFTLISRDAPAPIVPASGHYFPETGFRVDDNRIWDYFAHRGGLNAFGYPVSRTFRLQGFTVQFFQRRIVQLDQSGQPRLLNLLDSGLMPYPGFNGATVPTVNPGVVGAAPAPTDAVGVLQFVATHAPDQFGALNVGFHRTFQSTVSAAVAFPTGGDPSLLPGFNLEMWGVPTSAPQVDPNNHNFIYLRFQRGIMMYDGSCNCTRGILLADYLKSIITGQNLPADLDAEARGSTFYHQYDPSRPGWLHDPSALPGSDLTDAFTPGPG